MTKFILILAAVVVGVGAFIVFSPDEQREIGDPVLSVSPAASSSPGVSAVFTDGTYVLVASSSSMRWQGSRPFIEGYFDNGTVALSAGSTVVRTGRVESGSVTVNLATIAATSTGKGVGMDMLSNHLKSADFFDVEKFPTAVFTLSTLTPGEAGAYRVDGTLTLKGITKPVTFNAFVTQDGNRLTMVANEVVIDRTLWEVKYGSGKFFKELIGDKLVADTFAVSFTAVGELSR